MKLVYLTWINLWCGTFKYQDEIEWEFRRNQLIQVLKKLKSPISQNGVNRSHHKLLDDLLIQIITTTTKYSKSEHSMIIRQKFKDFFNLNDNPRVDQMIYDQKEAEREKDGLKVG